MAKLLNKKILATLVTGLAAASFVGVGFAGWVITQSDQGEQTGGIGADYTVNRSEVIIGAPTITYYYGSDATTEAASGLNQIMFGPNATSKSGGWLTATLTNGENANYYKEVLSAKIVFPFQYNTTATANSTALAVSGYGQIGGNTNLFYYGDSTTQTNYGAAVTNKVVGDFPAYGATGNGKGTYSIGFYTNSACSSAATSTGTNTAFTVAKTEYNTQLYLCFTVKFAWGEHFNYQNPMDFYATKTRTAYVSGSSGPTWADDAETSLGQLNSLTSCSFKLGFEVTAP